MVDQNLADAVGYYLRGSTGRHKPEERVAERVGNAIVCYLLGITSAESTVRYVDMKFHQFLVDSAGDLTLADFADRLSFVNQMLPSIAILEDVNRD